MTRSCYSGIRGYCFCEFCIAAQMKTAYVEANNSPSKPIDFKKFKRSIQLSPLEIFCRQFSDCSSPSNESSIPINRAYMSAPLNSPDFKQQQTVSLDLTQDDNQTKFLRILSDRLTKLANQQTQYVINNKTVRLTNLNNSTLLQRRSKVLNNIQVNTRASRLRSSVSESSGYETGEPTESPLPNASTTHCSSAGMLFNTSINTTSADSEPKNRIKFGPEDILETTNPLLLFSSNLANESVSKRSSRRRRKSSSSNKKEAGNAIVNEKPSTPVAYSSAKEAKSSKALSNVTNTLNTLDKKVASSSKLVIVLDQNSLCFFLPALIMLAERCLETIGNIV